MNRLSFFVLFGLLWCEAGITTELPVFEYRIVNIYPHDEKAFTQGLFFRDEWLYESTGLRRSSTIRKVRLRTGEVLQKYDLDDHYFGEGIVDWNDSLISVTWKSRRGTVLGLDSFEIRRHFEYDGEGWGLTRNDTHLILSDGTSTLRFLNPESFVVEKKITVTLDGQAVRNLNELEWIDGEIYSNVWRSDWVLKLNPDSGAVTGLIDFSGLLTPLERAKAGTDVLNGIAYDSESDRMFVTGKNWPKLFEIELIETTNKY